MLVDTGARIGRRFRKVLFSHPFRYPAVRFVPRTNKMTLHIFYSAIMFDEGLSIAICDIPVAESLQHLDPRCVGSILGCDLMLTCNVVRIHL
eukprot:scaffold399272_cov35-Attheya_sp.AAC.1